MTAPWLQVVPESGERVYVVARTRLVVPGRPYIVAECSGAAFPDAPGLERYRAGAMEQDPSLREALRAWRESDDSMGRRDASARGRLFQPPRLPSSTELSAREMHPSMMSRRWAADRRPGPA